MMVQPLRVDLIVKNSADLEIRCLRYSEVVIAVIRTVSFHAGFSAEVELMELAIRLLRNKDLKLISKTRVIYRVR